MNQSRLIRVLLMAGAVLTSATLAAAADPAAESKEEADAAYQLMMEAFYAEQEKQMDKMFASFGPFRFDPARLEIYTRHDERFVELTDRLTVRYLADPDVRKSYEKEISRGWFAGSAEDHARFKVVNWLNEPQYGYNAAVHSPNLSNGQVIIDGWRASSTRGPLANEEPCTNEWTKRKPIAALAADFERAVDSYMDWAEAEPSLMAAFNPYGVSFIDAEGKADYLRASIAVWLLANNEALRQSPTCAKTFTNFDAWADWDKNYGAQAEPFSGRQTPE